MRKCCHFLLLSTTVAFVAIVLANQAAGKELNTGVEAPGSYFDKLPKLFDFGYFKRTFSKSYGSILEEMTRRKLFMARAFRAFISGMKYRIRKSSFYLAINSMSDSTSGELNMRNNQVEAQHEAATRANEKRDIIDDQDDPIPNLVEVDASDNEVLAELNELSEENPDIRAHSNRLLLHKQQAVRRKRALTSENEHIHQRDLQMDDLIKYEEPVDENSSEDEQQPVELLVPSNNPYYKPIESKSRSIKDQKEPIKWFDVKSKNEAEGNRQNNAFIKITDPTDLTSFFSSTDVDKKVSLNVEDARGKPDEIFIDHRGDCMGEVRDQGDCGACYAFSSIALFEWLYCKSTGTFTPFSEQYIVDCGVHSNLQSCNGGGIKPTIDFIHNFGAELRGSYPYRKRQDQCPYSEPIDLKTTGYIRANLVTSVVVPYHKWATYLTFTPLITLVHQHQDFYEYGGGVHELHSCSKNSAHAMLLVGHGREDGQEYWLFRNSFSVGWGEKGYYKLSKNSNVGCIIVDGYTIGTKDGVKFEAEPQKNSAYDGKHVKNHYRAIMERDF